MSARNFIRLMFLLMVMTGLLLAFSTTGKQAASSGSTTRGARSINLQPQAVDGSMILETVSLHLFSAVQ